MLRYFIAALSVLSFSAPTTRSSAANAIYSVAPDVVNLPLDMRQRLASAACDSAIPDWQRHCMEALADPMKTASDPQLPSLNSPPVDGGWSPLVNPGRVAMTMVLDAPRNRIVVFGGKISAGNDLPPSDTWILNLDGQPRWTVLKITGPRPAARGSHVAIYDPIRQRMIISGGYGSEGNFWDTWALSLSGTPTWTQVPTVFPVPPPRSGHKAIYDPVRDRMIIFGGLGGQTFYNDTWALALSEPQSWTQLSPSGTPPPPRREHTATYDSAMDRMIIFGGGQELNYYFNDVWSLDFAGGGWSELLPSGEPPLGRRGAVAIYDETGGRMIMHAGYRGIALGDTWALSLDGTPAWTFLFSGPARFWPAAAYNSDDSSILMTGGAGGPVGLNNDLWVLSLGESPTWNEILSSTPIPPYRFAHSLIYDANDDRAVMFGGWTAYGWDVDRFNDVWSLSNGQSPSWTPIDPGTPKPSARNWHSAVFDPVRDQMIVFGGDDGVYRNDTWALSLSASRRPEWNELSPSGPLPTPRVGQTAVYDPIRDRVIVFGGASNARLNDTWVLSLSGTPAWTEITTSGQKPAGRYLHSAIYDPEQDRMVIYGGESTGTRFGDAWSLDLDEQVWSQLTPTGAPPSARYGHSSVHEPASGRMVVFGGFDGTARNDCFALSLRGQPAWRQLLPRFAPSPRVSHNAVVNADRSRMIIFGGSDYGNDSWALDWTTVTVLDEEPVIQSPRAEFLVPEPLVVDRLALTVLHDRAVSETAIRFALERASRVDLDVIDVSGRRVRTLLQKMLGSGEHEIRWNGRDDRGVLASAGVYLVRLEAERKIASRKIVLF